MTTYNGTTASGAFTYDLTNGIGKVRMLIPDRSSTDYVFTDAEITAFLTLNSDNVRRAAAEALETIAADQALVLKVIRTLDLTTDGPAVSRELRERAKALRSAADDADAGDDGGAFDFAEMAPNAFTRRERVYNQALREQS